MRLIRGAPGSGKTALIFREFSSAVRSGRTDLRIVAPTATLVRHYQHELARSGLVLDPGAVVSFSRFARERAPELALAPGDLVRALVRQCLQHPPPEFMRVPSTQGMADVVLETITLFENADCTHERLSRARGLSAGGKAFLRVWREVEAAIAARGFATRGQVIRRAAVAKQPGIVFLDGFLNFSPLERSLVRSLASTCDLTLTATEGPAADEIRRFAMELGAADCLLPGRARNPEIVAVQASSPEREADEIARRILALNEAGTEFPDIAVALRDVDTWLPLLRTTFDRFGIPARYYFSTPARNHPVAVFLGGLISCALTGWDFSSTLAALRAHPGWGHSADFDRFDFAVREAMPGRGADALAGICTSPWLRSRIEECLRIGVWRNRRVRPAVWQRRLEDFAAGVYRVHTIPEPGDYAAVETGRTHAAALRAWSACLDTAAAVCAVPGGEITLDEFHAVVLDELGSAAMQVPGDRRNVVHVMSSFEARQWQVKTLMICGMTARDYPRRHPQNLLFSDSDIAHLRGQGIPLRTATDEDRDERMLFTSLKTRASESLILTVSARNAGGQTIEKSEYLKDVKLTERSQVCRPAPVYAAESSAAAGVIGDESLAGLAEQHRSIRLTALENLTKCRFRFFADRTLRLQESPERPDQRLDPSRIGIVFHEAMEDWLTDRTRDFVELFEHTFEKACRDRNIPPGYHVEVQRVLSRRIARGVNESVRWPAELTETEVDCTLNFPGGVTVTCRVDRVDHVGQGNCVIVDYKSGKVANVDRLVESESSLQGPLYALAIRESRGLNPVAMVFLAIREGKPIGWGAIPGSPLELAPMPPDWIDRARDRTAARVESFLAGDIHAEPASPEDCKWCDFKYACRIEEAGEREQVITIGVSGGN